MMWDALEGFTDQDDYPIFPPCTTTSITDSQHADAQSKPNPASWGAVYAGADWSLSSLPPTPPNRDFTKKSDKQTENSARMYFIEGNNNFGFCRSVSLSVCSSASLVFPNLYLFVADDVHTTHSTFADVIY